MEQIAATKISVGAVLAILAIAVATLFLVRSSNIDVAHRQLPERSEQRRRRAGHDRARR
jgi:hypothetical protein